jgi:type III pantothenate kinase
LYYGYIGLVDGILDRIVEELAQTQPDAKPRVIASGGLAHLMAADSKYIKEIDDMLTLDGLRILFERNRGVRARGRAR